MKDTMSRYIQLDNWVFEIKTVRALRVDNYGEPYSAIANLNLHGDEAYVDGLMTSPDQDFSREDYRIFENFARKLNIKQAKFDRFKGQHMRSTIVDIAEPKEPGQMLDYQKESPSMYSWYK
jgi:hypothetical protein